MPILEQAHDFNIHGGAFYDIQGHQYNINIQNLNLAALNHATQQFQNVDQHKAVLGTLLDYLKKILLETDRQQSEAPLTPAEVEKVQSACERVEQIVTTIATKDLAWRLYHSQKIASQLGEAKDAIALATHTVHLEGPLDSSNLEAQIQEAHKHDEESLSKNLQEAARNDQTILGALNTGDWGHNGDRYNIQSLAEAFVKLASDVPSASSEPERKFIQKAANVLSRLSTYSKPGEIPSWHLNALEVTYNNDPASFLGRGGFGSVYRGEWNGLAVAVKVMNENLARAADQQSIELFRREIKTWVSLSHPHILPFYGACLAVLQPFIVSSLCPYGSARGFLGKFPESNPVTVLYQVASAMVYLHGRNIIHCDLKADNILLDSHKNALVADFGVVSIRNHLTSSATFQHDNTQQHGTLRWMAPERLDTRPLKRSSDIYSFAITAWELYTDGEIPFSDIPDVLLVQAVVDKERRPFRPSLLISDDLWAIVCMSWDPDPEKRPTFLDLYQKLKAISELAHISVKPEPIISSKGMPNPVLPNQTAIPVESFSELEPIKSKEQTDTAEHYLRYSVSDKSHYYLLAEHELIKSLMNIIDTGTEEARLIALVCFANFARSDDGKANLIKEPGFINTLATITAINIVDEKSIAFYHFSNSIKSDNKDTELVLHLLKMAAIAIPNAQYVAAICLGRIIIPGRKHKTASSIKSGLITHLMSISSSATPDCKYIIVKIFLIIYKLNDKQSNYSLSMQHGFAECLTDILATANSEGKVAAAECFQKLVLSIQGKTNFLQKLEPIEQLANMIKSANTPEEQSSAAACLTQFAHTSDVKQYILAEFELVEALINMIATTSPGAWQAIACLQALATSNQGKKYLSENTECIKVLVKFIAMPATEETFKALEFFQELIAFDNAILAEPGLMQLLAKIIASGSSNYQFVAVGCLAGCVLSDNGIKTFLAEPGIVTSLLSMMVMDVPISKYETIRCLLRLASSDEGSKYVLKDVTFARFLAYQAIRSSSKEVELIVECVTILTKSDDGKKHLLAEPEAASSLQHIAATGSNYAKDKAIKCLEVLNLPVSKESKPGLVQKFLNLF